jgi:hypothetical protein
MKPLEILKQKWALSNVTDLNYDIQENYHLKNGEIVDFGITLNGKALHLESIFRN